MEESVVQNLGEKGAEKARDLLSMASAAVEAYRKLSSGKALLDGISTITTTYGTSEYLDLLASLVLVIVFIRTTWGLFMLVTGIFSYVLTLFVEVAIALALFRIVLSPIIFFE
jgi:hypothetical protein